MQDFDYKPAADTGLPPAKRWRSEKREPGLPSYLTHLAVSLALRAYLRVYHRLRVTGREHIPAATPFVLIGNHGSHLDALVLAACLPRRHLGKVFPLAAGDIFFVAPPVSALSAALVNALPMWRKKVGRHALDDLRSRLHAGECGYILFPEGARTRDGEPLKWKPGLGMLVAGTDIPVIPCRLRGCFESLPPHARFPRPRTITASIGPPLRFPDTPNTREGWDHVARTLHENVMAIP